MTNNEFLQPTGSFRIQALLAENFDLIDCKYLVSKDGSKVETVRGYKNLVLTMAKFKLDLNELEFAILEMDRKQHDIAHFGIFGTFLFTEDSRESKPGDVAS